MWGNNTYLILILGWAGPLIVFQWLIGADMLLKRWKVLIPGVLIPTIYLTCMDGIALKAGTWTISPQQSLKIFIPIINVPIEEGLFFLVTNILVIQGLIFIMNFSRMTTRIRRMIALARHKPDPLDPLSGDAR